MSIAQHLLGIPSAHVLHKALMLRGDLPGFQILTQRTYCRS